MSKKTSLVLIIFCFFLTLNSSNFKHYKTSYKIDSSILLPSSILLGYSLYKNQNLSYSDSIKKINNPKNDFIFFDKYALFAYNQKFSKLSDYLVSICILMPYTLNFNKSFTSNRLKNNFIISESYFTSASLVAISKTFFMRKRPYTYIDNNSVKLLNNKDANYSFFSGHTTLAFTGAILFVKMNNTLNPGKNNIILNTSAITLASSVAILRYISGNHFPTDIFTGIIIGSVIACANLELHKNTHNSNNLSTYSIPMISFDIKF